MRLRRPLKAGEKIRVLVVDDSVVIRRLVTHALESDARVDVVGVAPNGRVALDRVEQLRPDVVTLDIEMPEMDGLEALRRLRREHPSLRVVMFSTLTERGAEATFEALSLGADDYVTKASNEGSLDQSMARLRGELVPKLRQFFIIEEPVAPSAAAAKPALAKTAPIAPITPARPLQPGPRGVAVGIGISTGGPNALAQILPQLPGDFPAPILIVQHMPPMFTRLLAERLDSSCLLRVQEAHDGDLVEPGHIYIAPGDFHMRVVGDEHCVRIRLDQSAPLNFCRPAVDALFLSMRDTYGCGVLAAVMTGMGQDGLVGVGALKAGGATIVAQDEASSVVWGMPGAVAKAGLADQVLGLEQISGFITSRLESPQCHR